MPRAPRRFDQNPPTSVRLDPKIRFAIAKAALKQGCSVSFKINQICREWMYRDDPHLKTDREILR